MSSSRAISNSGAVSGVTSGTVSGVVSGAISRVASGVGDNGAAVSGRGKAESGTGSPVNADVTAESMALDNGVVSPVGAGSPEVSIVGDVTLGAVLDKSGPASMFGVDVVAEAKSGAVPEVSDPPMNRLDQRAATPSAKSNNTVSIKPK